MNDIDLIDTNLSAKNETDEKDEDFGVRLALMMPIFGWWRVPITYQRRSVRKLRYDYFDENSKEFFFVGDTHVRTR